MKILIVEDEASFTILLYRALAPDFTIDMVRTGMSAIQKIEHQSYDVILLDLHLPDISGLKVCEYLRAHGITTPIIVVSGETQITQKVLLLEAGANDYLTKPCSIAELKARIRVAVQNRADSVKPVRLTFGNLELNTETRSVSREGIPVNLRPKEYAILECLLVHAGIVVSRSTIMSHAWNDGETDTNTIDVHIKFLRDKIDRPFDKALIKTVHGVGYKLELTPTAAKHYLTKDSSHEKSLIELTV